MVDGIAKDGAKSELYCGAIFSRRLNFVYCPNDIAGGLKERWAGIPFQFLVA
jgi:hypothetical protein